MTLSLRHKVFIDTDIGNDVDDAFALSFALLHPEIDLVGVSVVDNYGHLRARIVRAFLDAAGRTDVEVSIGCEASPTHAHVPPLPSQLDWAQRSLSPAACEDERSRLDACAHLHEVVSRYPNEVTVVAIGRLTNIDEALRRYPDLAGKVKGFAIMGGEVDVFRREHNFANDYLAADRVLAAKVPKFLATWSISRQLVLEAEDLETLWQRGTPVTHLLRSLQEVWGHKPVLYDLSPLLWLVDPRLFRTRMMCLRVETAGILTRGVVVECDAHSHAYGLPLSECSVAGLSVLHAEPTETTRAIDVARAKEIVLETLCRWPVCG